MGRFAGSVTIKAPIESVFDFHTDTNNLAKIMPGVVEIVSLSKRGAGHGTLIELVMRWRKIVTLKWLVKLEVFDRPNQLVDLQLKGPFKFFRHARTFVTTADGTKMTDDLTYELPFGLLGRTIDRTFVRRIVAAQFALRHRLTKALLEAP